jgi:hypothetical protein
MTDGLLLPPGGGRRIQTMTLKAGAEQSKIWSAFEAEVAPDSTSGHTCTSKPKRCSTC